MIMHICPWWFGHALASPIRRIVQDPRRIADAQVREGMQVLEAGPGMGFFTLEIARLVGTSGHVHAVDLQQRMLDGTRRRLEKAGLGDRLSTSLCRPDRLGVEASRYDLAFLFYMVHEVRDRARFFRQVHDALVPGGRAFYAEPVLHVSARSFDSGVEAAVGAGFVVSGCTPVPLSRAVVLTKDGSPGSGSDLLD